MLKLLRARRFQLFVILPLVLISGLLAVFLVTRGSGPGAGNLSGETCSKYKQSVFSNKLTDRIVDYSAEAKRTGIKECRDENDIKQLLSKGELVNVSSGRLYLVGNLTYSYPCLTHDSKELLEEIADRFRDKADAVGLKGSRFLVTSMTRTTDQIKKLRRNNTNASANSPHVNGNAFDISYVRFRTKKLFITDCDKRFLKEALAEVIVELKDENRCWATYERNQNCFHVVAR